MEAIFSSSSYVCGIFIHKKCTQPVSLPVKLPPFAEAVWPVIKNRQKPATKSTIENEITAVNHFIRFIGKEKTLADITNDDVKQFVIYLKKKKKPCQLTTIKTYLASLRAVINRMGGDGRELFHDIRIKHKRTTQLILDDKQIDMVRNKSIQEEGTHLALARDTYLFQYYAMGIPFVDLMNLTKHNLRNGHIVYRRVKTDIEVCVPFLPELQAICDRHKREGCPWLFPEWHEGKSIRPQVVLARYNRYLAELSDHYNLPKLTSYTIRRTWATHAYRKKVNIQIIQKALGHTNPATTQRYIQDIDQSAVDAACKMMALRPKQHKTAQKERKISTDC